MDIVLAHDAYRPPSYPVPLAYGITSRVAKQTRSTAAVAITMAAFVVEVRNVPSMNGEQTRRRDPASGLGL
jgi:hypothetical protein